MNKASKKEIEYILRTIPPLKRVKAVVVDMDKAQISAVKAVYPNAKVIFKIGFKSFASFR